MVKLMTIVSDNGGDGESGDGDNGDNGDGGDGDSCDGDSGDGDIGVGDNAQSHRAKQHNSHQILLTADDLIKPGSTLRAHCVCWSVCAHTDTI